MTQKQKIKELTATIKEMRQDGRELSKYCEELERKLKTALDRLSTIATGMNYTGECDNTWSETLKLQHTSSVGLKKIATMETRKKPFNRYFY